MSHHVCHKSGLPMAYWVVGPCPGCRAEARARAGECPNCGHQPHGLRCGAEGCRCVDLRYTNGGGEVAPINTTLVEALAEAKMARRCAGVWKAAAKRHRAACGRWVKGWVQTDAERCGLAVANARLHNSLRAIVAAFDDADMPCFDDQAKVEMHAVERFMGALNAARPLLDAEPTPASTDASPSSVPLATEADGSGPSA